jgi:Putative beta barrel porin-7 (BBP7)
MRKRWIAVMAGLLLAVSPVLAQSLPPPDPSLVVPPPPPPLPAEFGAPPPGRVIVQAPDRFQTGPLRFWLGAELLEWWVKSSPRPISLTANSATEVLNSDTRFGAFSGARITFGAWLDDRSNIGLEMNFVDLGRQRTSTFTSSDGAGFPALALPFNSLTPGNTGALVLQISSPGQASGNVLTTSTLEFWGLEFNTAWCLLRTNRMEWTVLAGFRYLDLQESLNISTLTNSDLSDNPTVTIFNDHFNTRNQFYGGQIATRINWGIDRFSVGFTGKLALGANHQSVEIQGFTNQFAPNGNGAGSTGGFFAQPTNSGRFSRTQFAFVPEGELKLNYQISPSVRLFLGYNILYWNQVIRPGSQIDRNLNLSQSSVLGNGVLTGPAAPAPLFNRTDFWAQGINLGFELRF